MPRFAANLSLLFADVPLLERFGRAAHAGFTAVECQFPYDHDVSAIRAALDRHALSLVLHNLPAGNWAAGDRGIACDPARAREFEAGVTRGIDVASQLGCGQLNVLAGIPPDGVSPALARATLVQNLGRAAQRTAAAGIRLLVEALNTRDVPGFLLSTTAQVRSVLADVGSDNVFLQYDTYHMQIMEGDVAASLAGSIDIIGHLQVADAPERHEPGTGSIDFAAIFPLIDRLGYGGWVGCEYIPAGRTEQGLAWAADYLAVRGPITPAW